MRKRWLVVIGTAILAVALATVAFAAKPIKLIVNGQEIRPDVPPELINGRTMVPIRWVAEALGIEVKWDEASRTVSLTRRQTSGLGTETSAKDRRIAMLEKAVLPASPEEVALAWAKGVKDRNGALQFALLGPELRERYEPDLERCGWVTGTSSPWVDSFEITATDEQDGTYRFKISFHMMTSAGDAGVDEAEIVVRQYQEGLNRQRSWLISEINYPCLGGILPAGQSGGRLRGAAEPTETLESVRTRDKALTRFDLRRESHRGLRSSPLACARLPIS